MKKVSSIVILFCSSVALAQVSSPSDSVGTISLTTVPAGADVYVDSLFVGKSPLKGLPLTPGRHAFRTYYPSVFSWDPLSESDTVLIAAGVNPDKHIVLGTRLRIESIPAGGTVVAGGANAGSTPLTVRSIDVLRDDVLIAKQGYDTVTVPLSELRNDVIRARFRSAISVSDPRTSAASQQNLGSRHCLTYASGATTVATGILAAYLKDQANKEFDHYLATRDAGSLSATRRLDRGSAVALVVSQISFIVLASILLSE